MAHSNPMRIAKTSLLICYAVCLISPPVVSCKSKAHQPNTRSAFRFLPLAALPPNCKPVFSRLNKIPYRLAVTGCAQQSSKNWQRGNNNGCNHHRRNNHLPSAGDNHQPHLSRNRLRLRYRVPTHKPRIVLHHAEAVPNHTGRIHTIPHGTICKTHTLL